MFKKTAFHALILLLVLSCTRASATSEDPKHRLSDYISKSFSIKATEDRQELLGFLTGEAKIRLSNWSDDQFRQAFIESKREFLKLSIREIKPVAKNETNITYEITYFQGKDKSMKITNRKLCQLVLENGKWLIHDVRNIKELVEYQNEMSLP